VQAEVRLDDEFFLGQVVQPFVFHQRSNDKITDVHSGTVQGIGPGIREAIRFALRFWIPGPRFAPARNTAERPSLVSDTRRARIICHVVSISLRARPRIADFDLREQFL
jgi:hypothetical protein